MARESNEHGPGSDFKGEGLRQHQTNARGDGPTKGGDFGVSEYPGRSMIAGDRKIMGGELSDKERGCGRPVPMGEGQMGASRNPDHGPHGHRKA